MSNQKAELKYCSPPKSSGLKTCSELVSFVCFSFQDRPVYLCADHVPEHLQGHPIDVHPCNYLGELE
jgi:hypothetical protein